VVPTLQNVVPTDVSTRGSGTQERQPRNGKFLFTVVMTSCSPRTHRVAIPQTPAGESCKSELAGASNDHIRH
jgi:hypothetical protein